MGVFNLSFHVVDGRDQQTALILEVGTEYFKHCIYSPFLSLQNAVCFINLMYLVPVLFTFYIEDVLEFKKIILVPKG